MLSGGGSSGVRWRCSGREDGPGGHGVEDCEHGFRMRLLGVIEGKDGESFRGKWEQWIVKQKFGGEYPSEGVGTTALSESAPNV